MWTQPEWFDPEQDVLLTPARLAGLVHPIRLRLLRLLREHGPSTATRLGARLGQSSGVTSYHLRVLAEHAFVVEVPELGTGRDRWWRSAHRSSEFTFRVPDEAGDEQQAELAEQFLRIVAETNFERAIGYIDSLAGRREQLPTVPWTMSDWLLWMTDEEVRALTAQLDTLALGYRRERADDRPAGARRVVFQVQLLPNDADVTGSEYPATEDPATEGGTP